MCSMRFEATDSDQTESTEMEREEVFQKILCKNNTFLADISPCECMEFLLLNRDPILFSHSPAKNTYTLLLASLIPKTTL